VRNVFSKRIFWSSATARRKPMTRQPATKRTPKITRFWREVIQRADSNSRRYWSKPTKAFTGRSLDDVNEIWIVHSMVAT
jgi:hypothetical protein